MEFCSELSNIVGSELRKKNSSGLSHLGYHGLRHHIGFVWADLLSWAHIIFFLMVLSGISEAGGLK